MKVRCPEYKDCPVTDCPHYEEHERMFGYGHLGGHGDVEICYCDKRMCGLREPQIEVKCAIVETDAIAFLEGELKGRELARA